jgi:hypothetical protein
MSPEELIRELAPWPDLDLPVRDGSGPPEEGLPPGHRGWAALVRSRGLRGLARAGIVVEAAAPAYSDEGAEEPADLTFEEIISAPPHRRVPRPHRLPTDSQVTLVAFALRRTAAWAPAAPVEADDAARPGFPDLLAGPPGPPRARHVPVPLVAADRVAHGPWHARAGIRIAGAAARGRVAANRAYVVGRDVVDRVAAAARQGIAEELGADAEGRPGGRRSFDPTPYVLALMLGLVVFGLIAALNNLSGARTARTDELPREAPPAVESTDALPDDVTTGTTVLIARHAGTAPARAA